MILRVGDTVNLYASILDFCGASQFVLVYDIGITISPNIPVPNGCLLLSGRTLEFQWTNASSSIDEHSCSVGTKLKTLGTAVTNSQGVATLSYTIQSDDLTLYSANSTYFDLRVCILGADTIPTQMSDTWSDHYADTLIIQSGSNMYVEFYIKPSSTQTLDQVYANVNSKFVDIVNIVMGIFSSISGATYIDSVITKDTINNVVVYRVNYYDSTPGLSIPRQMVAPIVIPLWLLVVLIGTTIISTGLLIYGTFFGEKKEFARSDISTLGKDITNECIKNANTTYPNWQTNVTEYNNRVIAIQICNLSVGTTIADPKYLDNPEFKTNAENTNAELQQWIDCLNGGTCTIGEAVTGVNTIAEDINDNYDTLTNYYQQLDACFNIPYIGCFKTNELIVYGLVAIGGTLIISNIVTKSSGGGGHTIIEREIYKEPSREPQNVQTYYPVSIKPKKHKK